MSERKIQFYDFSKYRFDVGNHRLLIGENQIEITQKTLDVLRFLIENRGRILKKDHLLETLWEGVFVEEKTLMQHIYMLRKALKQNGNNEVIIKTISKKGYSFVADVKEIFEDIPETGDSSTGKLNGFSNNKKGLPKVGSNFSKEPDVKTSISNRRNSKMLIFLAVLSVIIVVSIGFIYFHRQTETAASIKIKSVAVLPFQQIGGTKDEKLGLGLADVLISKIGNFNQLFVTPTSSIIRYSDAKNADIFDIGEKLNVEAVIDGTIQKDGEFVRVTVRLYEVKNRRQMWTQSFYENYSNIFSLQDTISEQISNEFSFKINNDTPESAKYPKNIKAHKAYSKGLYYWNLRSKEGLENAVKNFQTAIDEDPNFALAYAYLSDTYTLINHNQANSGLLSEPFDEQAETAAKKALELNPNSSEALTALAFIRIKEHKIVDSIKLLNKAIKTKSNNATAHQRLAWVLPLINKLDEAVDEMRLAQRLDPQSATINIALAQILNLSRQPKEALIYAEKSLEIAENSVKARLTLAESYEQMREFDNALVQIEKALEIEKNNFSALFAKSRIFAKKGKKVKAKKIFDELLAKKPPANFYYSIAIGHLAFGNIDNAFMWLKRSKKDDKSGIFYYHIKYDYDLDTLRNVAIFEPLLEMK